MNTNSGLKYSCREYIGQNLTVQFEYGWGWTVNVQDEICTAYENIDLVNLTSTIIVPSSFFAHEEADTRGFLGRIVGVDHPLHDSPVAAITMSDGFDYDFQNDRCPAWRFWLGVGELVRPLGSFPRVRGSHIIGGYGTVYDQSKVEKCAEPSGGSDAFPSGS